MPLWIWVGFFALVAGLLALDLGVLNRKAHVIGVREALGWTAFWVSLALLFNVLVYLLYEHRPNGAAAGGPASGWEAAVLFFNGYLLEESLSMDNMFVIALIFTYFRVPREHQHRTLFWGIVGALVLRGLMIGAGTALAHRFAWMMYVFGLILVASAVKMLLIGEQQVDPGRNLLVRLARRLCPVAPGFEGQRFFTRVDGRRAITPLFVVLLMVESADVVFAVDSIPAILGVTTDPFLVMTSNAFAILGLRSLFFALSAILDKFRYLKVSLVLVLIFIGIKMILGCETRVILKIPTSLSLAVVVAILAIGVAASMIRAPGPGASGPAGENRDAPRP